MVILLNGAILQHFLENLHESFTDQKLFPINVVSTFLCTIITQLTNLNKLSSVKPWNKAARCDICLENFFHH